jgi:predicted nucleic acid-binding protein
VSERTQRTCVVVDIHVLVAAVSGGDSPFESWPSPPPVSDNPAADCVGVLNDAVEFHLCFSRHILEHVVRILVDPEGFGWELGAAEEYVQVLNEIADHGPCGVREPTEEVVASEDWEDNRILALALECEATLIVSDDAAGLLALSPWRGIPIITTREFVNRVDTMPRSSSSVLPAEAADGRPEVRSSENERERTTYGR